MSNDTLPEIRFPGFTEDWEQRKLGEVVERVTRKNKKLESIRPLTISAQEGLIDQNEFFNKTVASRDVSGYYLVKKGEFAYNKSYSNGYPWGAVKRLNQYDMGVLSTLYIVFKPKKIDSDFLEKYYDTTYWYKEVSKHAAEGARNHGLLNIAASDFFETEIVMPLKIEEQQKIGAFFKQLDDTIALHQRKLDLLKETKKGFLQKMFPKNGAKVPEIRFPGFTGDWEQCKLGDIAKMYQPPTISGSELLDTGYPVFGANGYIGFYSKSNHLEDQVTISARGEGTGTPSYVKAPVWITGNSMVINVEDFDINKKFLYAMLLSYSLKKYITGGAQPQLTRDVLLKVPIIIPSYNEQFKIGTFFKQLDDTIALQQRKLDLLKETKKGFLQKMFV